jgi:membrane protein involved in colicin uptake
VHKQDRRDRAISAAVIVVVFFVAILVAALIWLAAS